MCCPELRSHPSRTTGISPTTRCRSRFRRRQPISKSTLALCIALTLLLFWLAYRLRMAQVASRIRTRLEERMGERERIARELHDTLLQSVQGLVLRFQSVAHRMAPGEPSRAHLESALKRADEVIVEGRNRVS